MTPARPTGSRPGARRPWPRLVAALLGVLVALVGASVATGAAIDEPALRSIDTSRMPLVRIVVAAPGSSAAKPPEIAITEDGVPVKDLVVSAPDAPAAIALAIDTSQSMQGDPITRALGAASAFAGGKREQDTVAVVGFDAASAVKQGLTSDPTTLRNAIGTLVLGATKGTALWDGVRDAIDATATNDVAAQRVVVLLTDGSDTASTATLDDVIALAKKDRVAVHAIALEGSTFDPKPLARLAAETGGTLRSAKSEELSGLYDAIAEEIAATYVVGYRSTVRGDVDMQLVVNGTTIEDTYKGGAVPELQGPTSGIVPASVTQEGWSILVLAGLVGALMLIAGLRLFPPHPRVSLVERLAPYDDKTQRAEAAKTAERARAGGRALSVATERVLGRLTIWKSLGAALDRADIPLRPAELFYIMMGGGLVLAVPMTLLGLPIPLRLVGLVGGFLAPFLFVRAKATKREKAFDAQLPDVLVAMAASLKAGHSFNQAVDAIIRDGTEPANKEFGRAANQIRLGRSADEALEDMARRLGSKNFEFVVLCVNIQRQVGGSLAELLDGVAETVRQRQQFARKVKALVAMGKMSAYALTGLPFLMAGVISVINPDYMKPLFETSTGKMMLIFACVGIVLGSLMLKKIVSFKVD